MSEREREKNAKLLVRLINSEEGNKTPICENVFLVLISITQIDPKLHYVNFITSRDCLSGGVRKRRGVFIINRDLTTTTTLLPLYFPFVDKLNNIVTLTN